MHKVIHTRRRLYVGLGWMIAATVAMLVPAPVSAQSRTAGDGAVTFTKDVAPILQRSCVQCHRAGQSAPMSLMTYEEARPWARAIKTRVAAREMPPWHLDRNVGIQKFKNDLSLSDQQIATIVNWVDAGAPRGNPADMPPPPQFADGAEWAIGKPDLVVRFPAVHGAGHRARPVSLGHGATRADRGPLHQGDSDSAGQCEFASRGAPFHHDHGGGAGGRRS